ncbi:MAG: PadR family transcriptional regulator [Candidatus Thorarchaeota archaeon]|nr:PadR family transcriptional regulator [Candidatus Thorarchaeota archaeon]
MTPNTSAMQERVLLALDDKPSHGYELLEVVRDSSSKLKLSTLYRWLHDMENVGLVQSKVVPGPHGPNRRIYSLTPRGEDELREIFKKSVEAVLHFYVDYRYSMSEELEAGFVRPKQTKNSLHALLVPAKRFTNKDVKLLEILVQKTKAEFVYTLGDPSSIDTEGINLKIVEGTAEDMAIGYSRFDEVWIDDTPSIDRLPFVLEECCRVLKEEGFLRIVAPLVSVAESKQPTLEQFIKISAVEFFPELGIIEGEQILTHLDALFSERGMEQAYSGLTVFWARK